jgi:hypothetical protein
MPKTETNLYISAKRQKAPILERDRRWAGQKAKH